MKRVFWLMLATLLIGFIATANGATFEEASPPSANEEATFEIPSVDENQVQETSGESETFARSLTEPAETSELQMQSNGENSAVPESPQDQESGSSAPQLIDKN